MQRRTFGLAALAATGLAGRAFAQAPYPAKPITMLVGFAAGSATDVVARVVSNSLAQQLGQPVVVQNLTGAASTISTAAVARAAPDGYTLTTVSGALAIGPAIYRDLKYDVARDLEPIGLVGTLPTVLLVREGLPVRTLAEFIVHARREGSKLNYGSSGIGGSTHLGTELLGEAIGARMTHIPYRGNGPAGAALLAGEIDVLLDTVLLAAQSTRTGRVRALAVTGAQRSPALPEVPTFAEAGLPGFDASIFFGLMGPAGLPAAVTARLNAALAAALQAPEVQRQLAETGGLRLTPGTPQQMRALVGAELAKWQTVARQSGIQAE
ncbi:MAG: tripartite tricarboxylate transporter substrate binding protein [Pseudorhodoferax sp.]